MTKKRYFILGLFLIVFTNSLSQNTIDSINCALKSNDYAKASYWTDKLENASLKYLFNKQINYYLSEKKIDTLGLTNLEAPKTKDSILYNCLLSDIYTLSRLKNKNKQIYNSHFQAYNMYSKNNDTISLNESLKKLCHHIIYNARNDTLAIKKYVNELNKYKMNSDDQFWSTYYKVQYNFFVKDFRLNNNTLTDSSVSNFRKANMLTLFDDLYVQSKLNQHHRAIYHTILGVYQGDWLHDYNKSNESFLKSKKHYGELNNMEAKRSIETLENNIAINHFKNKAFKKAIPLFKKSLMRDKKLLYKMYTNEWLYKSYDNLKRPDSTLFYFQEMTKIKDELKLIENTRQIKTIEAKYNFDEIIKDLEKEKEQNNSLKSTLGSVIPILGGTVLILIFIFYLYKRYKKKSTVLEEEQSETLQKLDELKSVVIKNHIILKDKTKIYVSELMYIKVEDHYLKIFTQDGNNHLVRGKLSQMKEELPPNFVQCHRSYIINRNFEKQKSNSNTFVMTDGQEIPISRSNKKKF